jgi:hypothetical protein
MSNAKISIRFFDDREVRAVWDEQNTKWWFSVLDIVALLTDQDDYTKTRNYWKYLKGKLKKEKNELVSATTQLKLLANDGKRYLSDMLDYTGIIVLGKEFPSKKAKGSPEMGLDGWSYMMRTPGKDFALRYFENQSALPVLMGFKPNKSYFLNWINPINGEWKSPLLLNRIKREHWLFLNFRINKIHVLWIGL